ncbi:hypothetical protein YC2023_061439 [Brassica napus]
MMKAVTVKAGMKLPWGQSRASSDYGTPTEDGAGGGEPPPEMAHCNGIFMSYSFGSREREYPHVRT